MMALCDDPGHQCAGCTYNAKYYRPECEGCRRKGNDAYGTLKEKAKYLTRKDKYIFKDRPYGSHRLLVKK